MLNNLHYYPDNLEEAIQMLEDKEALLNDTIEKYSKSVHRQSLLHESLVNVTTKFILMLKVNNSHTPTKLGAAAKYFHEIHLDPDTTQTWRDKVDDDFSGLIQIKLSLESHTANAVLVELKNFYKIPPF